MKFLDTAPAIEDRLEMLEKKFNALFVATAGDSIWFTSLPLRSTLYTSPESLNFNETAVIHVLPSYKVVAELLTRLNIREHT